MYKNQDFEAEISSESSADSDEEDMGCGYLLDQLNCYIECVKDVTDVCPQVEIEKNEIQKNPGKYYFVFFRGIKLDYFDNHQKRRRHYQDFIIKTTSAQQEAIISKGFNNYYNAPDLFGFFNYNYAEDKTCEIEEVAEQFAVSLHLREEIKNTETMKTYKSPPHMDKAIQKINDNNGNPFISVSLSPTIAFEYADIGNLLNPKYKNKKPKHRVMGEIQVIVIEANQYYSLDVADIEQLRRNSALGKKCAVERNNQEIIFHTKISANHVAGSVFVVYPSYHKQYPEKHALRYGVTQQNYTRNCPQRENPSKTSKLRKEILPKHFSEMAWKLAIKYIKTKNKHGEPLTISSKGTLIKPINYKYIYEENRKFIPSFNDESINQSKKESLKAAVQQGQVGPRELSGFELKDVNDQGNCFYEAVVNQLRLINHNFILETPLSTEAHHRLRLHIKGENFVDREWAEDIVFDRFVKTFSDLILAIIDTRNPNAGFTCYYFKDDAVVTNTGEMQITLPKDRSIIRIAATGNHFLSVTSHIALEKGALKSAFSHEPLPSVPRKRCASY